MGSTGLLRTEISTPPSHPPNPEVHAPIHLHRACLSVIFLLCSYFYSRSPCSSLSNVRWFGSNSISVPDARERLLPELVILMSSHPLIDSCGGIWKCLKLPLVLSFSYWRSRLHFDLSFVASDRVTTAVLLRFCTALCRLYPKVLYSLLVGFCFPYQLLFWFIKLFSTYTVEVWCHYRTLAGFLGRCLLRNQKSLKTIFALWMVFVPVKDPAILRSCLCSRDYSLVERIGLSPSLLEWNIVVLGSCFYLKVPSPTLSCCLRLSFVLWNTLEAPLVTDISHGHSVTSAWLVDCFSLKESLNKLPVSSLGWSGLRIVRFMTFMSVVDLSTFSPDWEFTVLSFEAASFLAIALTELLPHSFSSIMSAHYHPQHHSTLQRFRHRESSLCLHLFMCNGILYLLYLYSLHCSSGLLAILALFGSFVNCCSSYGD